MNKHLLSLLVAATAASAIQVGAVPAKPGLRTYTQPDGSQVTVRLVGDERCHYYLTEDNYPLLTDAQGRLCYAVENADGLPVPGKMVAENTGRRSAAVRSALQAYDPEVLTEKIRLQRQAASRMQVPQQGMGLFSTNFPHMGQTKNMVILVEYKDVKFKTQNPATYFNEMLNQEGFSKLGATGSCRDYYIDASHGLFKPDFDVYGPITLSQNMSYYGGNDMWGNDKNPEKMAIEACQQLDATVDFTQYDLDNDGYIDNVYIFYAGMGEASGGSADTVWPHSWEIAEAGGGIYKFDGKILNRYACSNEWMNGRSDGIGTFCHEYGHVLGLPDLYCTDNSNNKTPGEWCLMDMGSYNNDSRTPPTLGAFERNALGWIDLVELTGEASISMPHILGSNEAYIIPNPAKKTEFFLFENRQQSGWDAYLPGHGMLIWHIDFVQSIWDSNKTNNNSSHQYVDLEEANGSVTVRSGNPFPGTSKKTSFTSTTSPAMKTWAGGYIDLPITNIAETDGVITFDVKGGLQEVGDPTGIAAVDSLATPYSITLEWPAVDKVNNYLLDVWEADGNATDTAVVNYVEGYQARPITGTAHTVTGLQPETHYNFAIRAKAGSVVSANAATGSASTTPVTFGYKAPTVLEATDVAEKTFTANWEAMDEAVDYSLTVYASVPTGVSEVTANMGAGTQFALPEGWTTNVKTIYTVDTYAGAALPSLKFGVTGAYLQTAVTVGEIKSFGFWYRGASADKANSFDVQFRASAEDEWTTAATVKPLAASGTQYKVDAPAGMHQARVVYNKVGNGNMAIDDAVLELEAVQRDVVEGYNARSVGNVTEYAVDLSQIRLGSTMVEYKLSALNAAGTRSLESELQTVQLQAASGVADITAGETLGLHGRTVLFGGKPGTVVTVADAQGRIVVRAAASANGTAALTLDTPGFYIVNAGVKTLKVIVR